MEASLALALSGLGFILSVIWGGPLLKALKYFRLGKIIRVEGPESHITKMGTPTMGGLVIVGTVALVTVLLNAASISTLLLTVDTMVTEVKDGKKKNVEIGAVS